MEPWLRHCQAERADPVIGITTVPCPPFDLLFNGRARLSGDGSFCHILLQLVDDHVVVERYYRLPGSVRVHRTTCTHAILSLPETVT